METRVVSINTFTANDEYTLHNRENLPIPPYYIIRCNYIKNKSFFACFLLYFLESTLHFLAFSNKKKAIKSLILKDVVTQTNRRSYF